jgi:hypothetical protein
MIKQLNSNAFEPQILCEVCSEAVTNPICPSCLIQEIEAWTTLYPNLRRELIPRISKYIHRLDLRIIDEATQCIKCNDKKAIICPYCFTNKVLSELRNMKSNVLILKEFLEFFNFDFDHTGYSKEAEKLGII